MWCGTIITAQSLTWLCTHWNVNLRSLFTSTSASSVEDAKLIKVIPVTNAGSADICEIVRDNVRSSLWQVGGMLTRGRPVVKSALRSSSRNVDSSTIPPIVLSPLSSTHLTKNRNPSSPSFRILKEFPALASSPGSISIMATTPSTSLSRPLRNSSRNMLLHHSSYFRSSVLVCGCWTNTGITRCSHSSCW